MKKRIVILALLVSLAVFFTDRQTVLASETTQASESENGEKAVSKSLDEETFSAVVDFVKEKLDSGELETKEQIRQVIKEGETEFDFDLPENTEDMIVNAADKIQKMGLDSEVLAQKARELYDTYGDEIVENAENVLSGELKEMGDAVKEQLVEPIKDAAAETIKATAKNFLTDLKNSVVNFVKNIFHI